VENWAQTLKPAQVRVKRVIFFTGFFLRPKRFFFTGFFFAAQTIFFYWVFFLRPKRFFLLGQFFLKHLLGHFFKAFTGSFFL
jgi:hypothetical protein